MCFDTEETLLRHNLYHMFIKFQMFQVIQPERALYVQAANCIEEKEWLVECYS